MATTQMALETRGVSRSSPDWPILVVLRYANPTMQGGGRDGDVSASHHLRHASVVESHGSRSRPKVGESSSHSVCHKSCLWVNTSTGLSREVEGDTLLIADEGHLLLLLLGEHDLLSLS